MQRKKPKNPQCRGAQWVKMEMSIKCVVWEVAFQRFQLNVSALQSKGIFFFLNVDFSQKSGFPDFGS